MTFDGPSGLIPDTLRGRDAMCTTSIFAARVFRVRRTLYNRSMSLRATRGAIIALLLAGCASQSPVKSVDRMDERTAVTMGVLQEPLLFIESELYDILDTTPNQPTMIYLGPVEWDRSGEYTYGLWVEIAPGVGGHRPQRPHACRAPVTFGARRWPGDAFSSMRSPEKHHQSV